MYNFTHGTIFMIDKDEYVVRKANGKDIEVENLSYESIETWNLNHLVEKWENGELQFKMNPDLQFESDYPDFELVPEELKKQAKYRFSVISPVLDGEVLPSEIPVYLSSLSPKISQATFYNWKRRFEKSKDIRSLIPRTGSRGPKGHISDEAAIKIIDEVIDDFLYSGEKYTIEFLYGEYLSRIRELNEYREDNYKVTPVSQSTFYRRKKEILNIHKIDSIKYGKVIADLNRNGSQYTVKVSRPLERVELDWTPVDALLLDPNTLKPRRPNLVYAIDKFTNHPLGFFVTFNEIDSNAVKQCLLHCLMPKNYIKEAYPLVQHEWEAYGKPDNLILDNSKVNESIDIEDVCFQLGIEKTFCPVDSGYIKGTIERAFRTINTKAIHTLKGTTFSNIFERGRYNSENKACLTMQAFIYICHIAMVDLVANQFNATIRETPAAKWKKGVEENPQLVTSLSRTKKDLLLILMGGIEHRKITNKGIVLKGEYYNSADLMALRYEMRRRGLEKEKVTIRFDLSDVRRIFVYNPITERYIEVLNKGLEDKGFSVEMPVPYASLELDSRDFYKAKELETDLESVNKAHRNIGYIEKEETKKIKKIKRVKVKTEEKSNVIENTLMGISSEGITKIQLGLPEVADSIQILKEETIKKPGRNKKIKVEKEQKQDEVEKESYFVGFEDDIDDLPNWDVHYKGGKDK